MIGWRNIALLAQTIAHETLWLTWDQQLRNTFRVYRMVPHGGRVDEAVCDGTSEAGGTE